MADFGLTPAGFVLKRTYDILQDLVVQLSTVADPQTGETLTPDLDNADDPIIQVTNAFADLLGLAWEQLQLVNGQYDPLLSLGVGLSGLVQLNGLRRKPGGPSTVVLLLMGTPGLAVPEGKRVATADGKVVFTLPQFSFDENGQTAVIGTCTQDGPSVALAELVVKILTPVYGWVSVINMADAILGTEEETDEELRARRQASTEKTGRSTIEDIFGNISDLEGVTFCRLYQNITLEEDARGIPAKTVAPVIVGGVDAVIAETLFNQIGLGVDTFGTTTVTIEDDQGIEYDMKFSRPGSKEVYVKCTYTVINSRVYPSDGQAKVKAAILAYAVGGPAALGIPSSAGFDPAGYVPGATVYASELYTAVNSIPGIQVNSLYVGLAADPNGASVAVAWNEAAHFTEAHISLTVN